MEDFDHVWAFLDPIVNQDRRMHQLADTGTVFDRAANVRKALEKIDVIEKGVAEAFRRSRKVDPRIIEDFLEVS